MQSVHTRVGHEFERSAEFSVAGSGAGSYVENVSGERTQSFDVSTAGCRLHDAIAALVLILITHKKKKKKLMCETTVPTPLLLARYVYMVYRCN